HTSFFFFFFIDTSTTEIYTLSLHDALPILCRQLRVARSGYYAWCRRTESPRAIENRRLLVHIRAAHDLGRGEYGSPRVHRELRRSEEHTSELQSRGHLVCRLLLEKKKKKK